MTPSPAPARPPRAIAALALLAAAAAALVSLLAVPWTPPLRSPGSGDIPLAERVEELLPDRGGVGVTVALTEDGRTRTAALGTRDGQHPLTPDALFETASVQKLLTAQLLADMTVSGDVALNDTLGELWPDVRFAVPAVADTTLEQLATHTSGLPSIPFGADTGIYTALPNYILGGDAYTHLGDPVQAAARLTDVDPGTGFAYSNLGYAVLGRTLAHTADRSYADLLQERVLEPLGMDDTGVRSQGFPPGATLPHRGPHTPVAPWTNTGYAAVGTSAWTSTDDLVKMLHAAADPDSAVSALTHTPRARVDGYQQRDGHVGLGWMLWKTDTGDVSWHNGLNGGTRTFVAHTGDGRSVVVLANSARTPVEHVGFALLGIDAPEFDESGPAPAVPVTATILLCLVAPAAAAARMLRVRPGRLGRQLDRLAILTHLLWGVALWLLSLRMGEWSAVPVALWAVVGGGLLGAAVLLGAWRWPTVPWARGRRAWLRWTVFALPSAAAVALLLTEASVLAYLP